MEKENNNFIKPSKKIYDIMDANKNGKIDIEDIIFLGLRIPGIKISRSEFLKRELNKNYSENIITKAIKETPAKAGIKV